MELAETMKRAMAKQAEAERERRAKVIAAEGELQASEKLAQAARVMSTAPSSIQLRYLQTLSEIAVEKNSTIVFPLPIEFLKHFAGESLTGANMGAGKNSLDETIADKVGDQSEPEPRMKVGN